MFFGSWRCRLRRSRQGQSTIKIIIRAIIWLALSDSWRKLDPAMENTNTEQTPEAIASEIERLMAKLAKQTKTNVHADFLLCTGQIHWQVVELQPNPGNAFGFLTRSGGRCPTFAEAHAKCIAAGFGGGK